ncbi:Zinc finger CCHC-type and RNA-binding motif-containing protein 1 [Chionoecetes opilio]|uniref:Zinc finger CCHC-type and RNA-binding motif-containing protein 1 n=1 Tax=Chionoecetes opilio TaxID=41210 RepID=A0A8J4YDU2_CHIOP|nr:Zinc finger CCHC-type and RNA-binding motif-containing protein 1 [Chionoecetes opilio]
MASAALNKGGTKGSLAPSTTTVYVSNLPFTLTNTDLHKVFEKFGKVVRVTILRERESRRSRGVAFLLYLTREAAAACVGNTDGQTLFGRTLKASIAKDNGRAPEFIRRREYPDKSRCYECGEGGHLSYTCPANLLGSREPVKKKSKKRKREGEQKDKNSFKTGDTDEEADEEEEEIVEEESLSAAIRYQQDLREAESSQGVTAASALMKTGTEEKHRAKIKKSCYFSDEEEVSDS